MKRPLMYAAGGFVLGEVCLLLPVGLCAGIPAMVLAGVCYLWIRRKESGRSLLWWILPLFVVFGMGRLHMDRLETERTKQIAERVKEIPLQLEGEVADIREGGESVSLKLSGTTLYAGEGCVDYPAVMVYVDAEEFQTYRRSGTCVNAEGREDAERREEAKGRGNAERREDAKGRGNAEGCEDAEGRGNVEGCEIRIGMRVSVRGELERFQPPGNPGEFDYGAYYHAVGIEGRMYGKELQVTDESYSPYLDSIYRIKKKAVQILEEICSPEDQGVFQAVVLGDKNGLLEDIRQMYQKNGISHLLAVSGLHVSMIGLGLYHLLRKRGLGFEAAGAAAAAVTVSYGVLTGGSASVVRAVMMVCFQFLADRMGRTYDTLSAAAAAALFLLIRSPAFLFQSGFQLSFGAVFAIGSVGPRLVRWLEGKGREGRWHRIWSRTVSISISIQIVTYPMIAYHFFEYPLYGTLLNLLVVPLVGYVLGSGAAGILLGAVTPWLGELAIGTGHYILAFYQWLCLKFQQFPGAVQIVGRPAIWQILLYGGMWIGVLAAMEYGEGRRWTGRRRTERMQMGRIQEGIMQAGRMLAKKYLILAAALILGTVILRPLPISGMSAIFLDVGQGDGIALRTKDAVVLVDGGSSDNKKLGKQVLEPFLKSQAIRNIDYAIVSHGDQDHISGLLYLMESDCGIRIDNLILPVLGREDEAYETLVELAGKRGTAIYWMQAGHRLKKGKLEIECLYAGDESRKSERNEHSLMLKVSYGSAGILLTGDISAEGERDWMEQEQKEREQKGQEQKRQEQTGIQVLKVAHHGSRYSSSAEFLSRIAPVWAVISCGEKNRYGHPSQETLKRLESQGAECLITMDQGAVTVKTDGEEIEIGGFREEAERR